MNVKSETDWARVNAMTDHEIDTSDIPELGPEFFARARIRMPDGSAVLKVHVPRHVLAWYDAQGGDIEERMAAVLHSFAEAQGMTRGIAGIPPAT